MSGSLIELGMVATVLSLALAIVCIAASVAGANSNQALFIRVARQALLASLALVSLGCFPAIWLFFQNAFALC